MGVIVDIDGTLLIRGVMPIAKTISAVNLNKDVYLVTGRPESERAKTVLALKTARVSYKALLMNNTGSNVPAMQIRSKRANAIRIMARNTITQAIDDNPAAREMYKSLGIANVTAK